MLHKIRDILLRDKYFILLAIFVFIINLVFASQVELSFDEAYYWIYSENLAWGYFDHPPMVALMIKIGTLIFGQTELGVRFAFNLLFIGSLFFVWSLVERKNHLLFWVSVLMMPLLSFSGVVAIPDTPKLFFVAMYFYFLKRYLEKDNLFQIMMLSCSIAGMFYSKYHGILIVFLTVLAYPSFLKKKSFYAIVVLVIVLFLPHIYWQYKNDFVSFKFHLTGRKEKHFDIKNILDYIAGQIMLLGFFNFFIFCYLFYKNKFKHPFERIMLLNSFGFLIFLLLLSFRNQIEANWTITVTICLIILFINRLENKKLYLTLAIIPLFLVMSMRIILIYPDPFIGLFDNPKDPDENRLNEIVDWKTKKIPEVVAACEGRKLVADSYQIAAKLSFYLKQKLPALHLNSRESQYSILNYQKTITPDERICFLTSEDDMTSVKIETYYKDPIFVVKNTSLQELASFYGVTYEKIIRNSK